jgi:hypothetical protein
MAQLKPLAVAHTQQHGMNQILTSPYLEEFSTGLHLIQGAFELRQLVLRVETETQVPVAQGRGSSENFL